MRYIRNRRCGYTWNWEYIHNRNDEGMDIEVFSAMNEMKSNG